MEQRAYRKLGVWSDAMSVVESVYQLCESMPSDERFGLTSQMKRAAVSIPSNIAEGKRRGSDKDFCRFLKIAFGSGAELETQLELTMRLQLVDPDRCSDVLNQLDSLMMSLNALIQVVKATGN